MKHNIRELTRAEEQVMQILWRLGKGFVKDIIAHFDDPKPAYNTVSTVIRILERKGFVSYKQYGNTYQYFPTVSRDAYTSSFLGTFVGKYFAHSYKDMVSFFAKKEDISLQELEEMKKLVDQEIQRKRKP